MRRSSLLTAIRTAFRGLELPLRGETIVVGLSGGPDSVALLDALASLSVAGGFRVAAAHLDHGLRPDSAEDAAFCAELCERLGVSLRTGVADVRARARGERGGLEQAARRARYEFLRSVRRELGAAAVAVAHTRDDQAETLVLRLLRGSGRSGLAGMRPRSGDILRPLLAVSRVEVLAHLRDRGLPWCEDPTNSDRSLARNRVRHELLPYLEERFNPRLREALARTATLLAEEADLLSALAGERLEPALRADSGEVVVLDRRLLALMPRPLARIALRQAIERAGSLRSVSAAHVAKILELACSQKASGRLPLPGGREVVIRSGEIRVAPRTAFGAAMRYGDLRVSQGRGASGRQGPVKAGVEVRSR